MIHEAPELPSIETYRSECLVYAVADEGILGIWGGTSTKERMAMRAHGVAVA